MTLAKENTAGLLHFKSKVGHGHITAHHNFKQKHILFEDISEDTAWCTSVSSFKGNTCNILWRQASHTWCLLFNLAIFSLVVCLCVCACVCLVLGLPTAQKVSEHPVLSGTSVEGQVHGKCEQTLFLLHCLSFVLFDQIKLHEKCSTAVKKYVNLCGVYLLVKQIMVWFSWSLHFCPAVS